MALTPLTTKRIKPSHLAETKASERRMRCFHDSPAI
jgi:hypothetical protein